MQYLVLGYDGDDDEALTRRLAVREAHIALGDKLRDEGKMLYGAAILDDTDKMIGSALICDFESREELDRWLEKEPYVTGGVWKKIDVQKCRVGPSFVGLKRESSEAR
ncbi:MAG: YciI family protein [Cyanobacteria bacterium]|nr:YciI family protein [Cyanobacteriota bacterium]